MQHNFVADESVDFRIVLALREQGFIVFSILETSPSITDDEVLNIAFEKNCVLITEDKDFGELVFRLKKKNNGVVLLRLMSEDWETKIHIIKTAFFNHLDEFYQAFTVLTKDTIRIKKN